MTRRSYLGELAAWAKKRAAKKRRQDTSVVTFLAVREDVKTAMQAGYSVTTIYEHMHETGKIKCSYETFRKHVHRYVKASSVTHAPMNTADNLEKEEQTTPPIRTAMSKKTEPAQITGLSFNPTPKKEDLL